MGAEESTPVEGNVDELSPEGEGNELGYEDGAVVDIPEEERMGYRVLSVSPNSPASTPDNPNLVVSFLDVLIAANGKRLLDDDWFVKCIRESENKDLVLAVYNIKSRTLRDVTMRPTRDWGDGKSLLGLTIKYDTFDEDGEDLTLRVLEVHDGSPAADAGIEPFNDYMLGTSLITFQDMDDLNDVVLSFLDRPVEFFVYNSARDTIRRVVVVPSHKWGGEGILGCEIGQGYLHRIPTQMRDTIGVNEFATAGTKGAHASRDAPLMGPRVATPYRPGCIILDDDDDGVGDSHVMVLLDWANRSATAKARLRKENVAFVD